MGLSNTSLIAEVIAETTDSPYGLRCMVNIDEILGVPITFLLCLGDHLVCDGVENCVNGEDEYGCGKL